MKDPVGYVVAGLQPVSAASRTMTVVGVKNHSAIEAVRTGVATSIDVNNLINAFNLSLALAYMGQGGDWIPELMEAQAAIREACKRPRFLFNAMELQAVNLAMSVHDVQMADPKTTVQMLEQAMAGLRKISASGKADQLCFGAYDNRDDMR